MQRGRAGSNGGQRRQGSAAGAALAFAVVALCGALLACGETAPVAAPGGAMHPLLQQQATAQAEQAPELAEARDAAATAVAAREAAEAARREQARADAAALLGAAVTWREHGQPARAIELAQQALEKWPDYPEARHFLAEVSAQATAEARTAQATATALARGTGRSPGRSTPVPQATPTPIPLGSPQPGDEDTINRALAIIRGVDNAQLRDVAAAMAQRQTAIGFGRLPAGVGALYQPLQNTIIVADRYRQSSVESIAGLLAHEGTHVYDHARGKLGGTSIDCYDLEGRAFTNQARLWEALYGRDGKKNPAGELEQQMNRILFVVNEKPLTFAIELLGLYKHQCGA
jgi:hypothetical protein